MGSASGIPVRAGTLAAVAVVLAACAQGAVPSRSCSAPEQRQFDFWAGDWSVAQHGRTVGRNEIRAVLDGCALEEHWRGTGGVEGRSLTFYDRRRERWHQTWIDSGGEPLYLDGGWRDDAMRLEGEGRDADGPLRHRVTWTRDGADVRQHWETSRDGVQWQTVFDGRYTRVTTLR